MLRENPNELFGKPNISNHHAVHIKYKFSCQLYFNKGKDKSLTIESSPYLNTDDTF